MRGVCTGGGDACGGDTPHSPPLPRAAAETGRRARAPTAAEMYAGGDNALMGRERSAKVRVKRKYLRNVAAILCSCKGKRWMQKGKK